MNLDGPACAWVKGQTIGGESSVPSAKFRLAPGFVEAEPDVRGNAVLAHAIPARRHVGGGFSFRHIIDAGAAAELDDRGHVLQLGGSRGDQGE